MSDMQAKVLNIDPSVNGTATHKPDVAPAITGKDIERLEAEIGGVVAEHKRVWKYSDNISDCLDDAFDELRLLEKKMRR